MKELFCFAQEHLVKELEDVCCGLTVVGKSLEGVEEEEDDDDASNASSTSKAASECLSLLILAEDFKARLLMEECLQRFVEFGGELMSTSHWGEVVETRPNLVARVVAFVWKAFRDDKRPATFPGRKCGRCGAEGGGGGGC